jgi:hypothetical protein
MSQRPLVFAPLGILDLGRVPAGGSGARFFAINGVQHVCKSRTASNGVWVCYNEFFAARAGEGVGLPIPPFQVVSFRGGSPQPEMWFCSRRIQPGQNPDSLSYTRLSNPEILGILVVFDLWICNTDRSNTNLYVEKRPDGNEKLFLIDHGHSLLTNGDLNALRSDQFRNARRTIGGCPDLAGAITNANELAHGLRALNALPEREIRAWAEESPHEWIPDPGLIAGLIEFLLERREGMQNLLESSLHLFPNMTRGAK